MIGLSVQMRGMVTAAPEAPVQQEPGTEAAEAFARLVQSVRDIAGTVSAEEGGDFASDTPDDDGDPLKEQIALLLQQLGLPGGATLNGDTAPRKDSEEVTRPNTVRAELVEAPSFLEEKKSPSTSSGRAEGGERGADGATASFAEALPLPTLDASADAPGLLQVQPAATLPSDTLTVDATQLPDTVQHHLDLAHDAEWLDQLARDIARTADSGGRLRFQLNPEHLGSLHVEVAAGAEGASVRMRADSEAARAILVDAQPRLLAEARAQGMRIADTQIDLGGQGAGHRYQPPPAAFVRTASFHSPEAASGPTLSQRDRYA